MLAAPVAAAPPAVQTTGAGDGLVLRSAEGAARLHLPGGRQVSLPLPPRGEITALAGRPDAWAAVGTAERAGRAHVLVVTGDEASARQLPAPATTPARLRTQPVVFVGDEGLDGVAWLEGEDRGSLGVRAAAWNGTAWSAPQVVAPSGRGSQLALSGAVLADGSWLLVWAAYDGKDDEILWSQGRDGEWTAPRRVVADNASPDITPALIATRSGALLAWSRYDGSDYRLVTATFSGGRWGAMETVGPAGSVLPSFVAGSDGAYLLYRTALPGGWQVHEVDRQGALRRATAVASEGSERPLVLPAGEAGVRFLFEGRGAESTVAWRASGR
jgi:hypothetical protein